MSDIKGEICATSLRIYLNDATVGKKECKMEVCSSEQKYLLNMPIVFGCTLRGLTSGFL